MNRMSQSLGPAGNDPVLFRNHIVFENGESWETISYALPWWPDDPISEWMIPGTYQEGGTHAITV